MKQQLSLRAPDRLSLRLRSVEWADAEHLRAWKNAHRDAFFFKDLISPEDQHRWMEAYFTREDDNMFVVEADGQPVGCMGYRLIDGRGDVYNVILGIPEAGGRGMMSLALRLMLTQARERVSTIGLKVLKTNPAIAFYRRAGFDVASDRGDHLELTLNWARFQPIEGI